MISNYQNNNNNNNNDYTVDPSPATTPEIKGRYRRKLSANDNRAKAREILSWPQWFRMDLHFGIKIIELILEINYSIKNIAFNCLLCSKYNEHRDEAIS